MKIGVPWLENGLPPGAEIYLLMAEDDLLETEYHFPKTEDDLLKAEEHFPKTEAHLLRAEDDFPKAAVHLLMAEAHFPKAEDHFPGFDAGFSNRANSTASSVYSLGENLDKLLSLVFKKILTVNELMRYKTDLARFTNPFPLCHLQVLHWLSASSD